MNLGGGPKNSFNNGCMQDEKSSEQRQMQQGQLRRTKVAQGDCTLQRSVSYGRLLPNGVLERIQSECSARRINFYSPQMQHAMKRTARWSYEVFGTQHPVTSKTKDKPKRFFNGDEVREDVEVPNILVVYCFLALKYVRNEETKRVEHADADVTPLVPEELEKDDVEAQQALNLLRSYAVGTGYREKVTELRQPSTYWISTDPMKNMRRVVEKYLNAGRGPSDGEAYNGDEPYMMLACLKTSADHFGVRLLQELTQETDLRQRGQDINKLRDSVVEVNGMFDDLGNIVKQQEDNINTIGINADQAHAQTLQGAKNVNEAARQGGSWWWPGRLLGYPDPLVAAERTVDQAQTNRQADARRCPGFWDQVSGSKSERRYRAVWNQHHDVAENVKALMRNYKDRTLFGCYSSRGIGASVTYREEAAKVITDIDNLGSSLEEKAKAAKIIEILTQAIDNDNIKSKTDYSAFRARCKFALNRLEVIAGGTLRQHRLEY